MALEDKVSICPKCGEDEYLFKPGEKPTVNKCNYCGAELLHTQITAEEKFLIERISKDLDFFMAMLKLRDDDIIEYKTKIAKWREEAKAAGCYGKPKDKVSCPKCGSTSITTGQRGYSLLTGLLGSGKTVNRCANCGYKWEPKR